MAVARALDLSSVASSSIATSNIATSSIATSSNATSSIASDAITFDERSVIIDGRRKLMLSGAVHYARVMPEDWDRVLGMAKEMGLNTIQTYVMWNFHEHVRGQVSWSGRRNVTRFIELAGRHGLDVAVRIGPYVCGEYQFGGIPFWLRTLDNVSCFRCSDPVWEREMERFVGEVVDVVRPQLKSRGGPVVMLQVENEYNGPDLPYLKWAVEMARNQTTEVPWVLCHDHAKCAAVNTAADGSHVDNALCSINGFWMEERTKDFSQPSPAWISDLHTENPGQPSIWTEDQGWFDQWGIAQRVRDPADQAYGIARFFAFGGSWHNFYMLTGGNNYGRQSGGQVVTAYAPDTAIDYLLLRHEPRFSHFGALFRTLSDASSELLRHPIATPTALTAGSNATTYLALQPCTDTDPAHVGTLDAAQQWALDTSSSPGALRNLGSGLCVDALPKDYATVTLRACDGVAADEALQWAYNATSQQYASAATAPCEAKGAKGKRCHRCLDMLGGGKEGGVDSWDCKAAGDGELDNQRWRPYQPRSGAAGIVGATGGLCLTAATTGGGGCEVHEYGDVAFLSNFEEEKTWEVEYEGRTYLLPNRTVCILDTTSGAVLWNSTDVWAHVAPEAAAGSEAAPPTGAASSSSSASDGWSVFLEAAGFGAKQRTADAPLEMLSLTNDDTDYLWYSARVAATSATPNVSAKGANGAIAYAYVDGKPLAAGAGSEESVGQQVSSSVEENGGGVDVQLDILLCAMGTSNGGVSPHSTKGLQQGGVLVDGVDVSAAGKATWTHRWMLRGEAQQIYTAAGARSVEWQTVTPALEAGAALAWFRASFDLPPTAPNATQTSFALDLSTMNKGAAYVNGFNIGRYWLEAGTCSGACAPPVKSGHCYMHWKGCGKPTQTLYHVPDEVLKPTGNLVVLFEETANSVQARDLSGVRLRALHEHPAFD